VPSVAVRQIWPHVIAGQILVIAGFPFLALWAFHFAPSLPPPKRLELIDATKPQLLNVDEVFRSEDYPDDALKAEREGQVRLRVLVSPTGDVISCDLMKSSGVDSLDRQSCDLLRRRGWFAPARDSQGAAIAGVTELPIRWSLEPQRYAEVATFNRLTMPVAKDGKMPSCKFEVFVLGEKQREEDCSADVEFQATTWGQIKHVRGRNLISEFHLLSPTHHPRPGEGGGEHTMIRTMVDFEVDDEGKATDCKVIEDNTEGFLEPCAMIIGQDMRFGKPRPGKPHPRFRLLGIIYTRP
jgi:TonB family protein